MWNRRQCTRFNGASYISQRGAEAIYTPEGRRQITETVDYYLRNASFVRCDNITLGYTWDNLLNDKLRLRLFGAVQNPFVITKYKGVDPEVFGGIDNSVYPRATTYSLGLVATF